MPYIGSAAAVVSNHIYTYLYGNLAVADFEFELYSDQGLAVLQENLLKIVTELNGGCLERYCFYFSLPNLSDVGRCSFRAGRFLVILTDHSSPDTGDLHIAPGNLGAAGLGQVSAMPYTFTHQAKPRLQVLDAFLDGGLRAILAKSEHSMLVLHSCGGVVAHAEPLNYLKRLTESSTETPSRKEFSQVVAFSQQHLQLAFTNRFLSDYAVNCFIHDKVHIGGTIFDDQKLGAHTEVMWFKEGEATRFFWGHPVAQPHGNAVPPMCNHCYRLLPWKVDNGDSGKSKSKNEKVTIVHVCSGCENKVEYDLPAGAEWVRNHTYGNLERGAWFVVKEKKEKKPAF